jgi:hypothetical protein
MCLYFFVLFENFVGLVVLLIWCVMLKIRHRAYFLFLHFAEFAVPDTIFGFVNRIHKFKCDFCRAIGHKGIIGCRIDFKFKLEAKPNQFSFLDEIGTLFSGLLQDLRLPNDDYFKSWFDSFKSQFSLSLNIGFRARDLVSPQSIVEAIKQLVGLVDTCVDGSGIFVDLADAAIKSTLAVDLKAFKTSFGGFQKDIGASFERIVATPMSIVSEVGPLVASATALQAQASAIIESFRKAGVIADPKALRQAALEATAKRSLPCLAVIQTASEVAPLTMSFVDLLKQKVESFVTTGLSVDSLRSGLTALSTSFGNIQSKVAETATVTAAACTTAGGACSEVSTAVASMSSTMHSMKSSFDESTVYLFCLYDVSQNVADELFKLATDLVSGLSADTLTKVPTDAAGLKSAAGDALKGACNAAANLLSRCNVPQGGGMLAKGARFVSELLTDGLEMVCNIKLALGELSLKITNPFDIDISKILGYLQKGLERIEKWFDSLHFDNFQLKLEHWRLPDILPVRFPNKIKIRAPFIFTRTFLFPLVSVRQAEILSVNMTTVIFTLLVAFIVAPVCHCFVLCPVLAPLTSCLQLTFCDYCFRVGFQMA